METQVRLVRTALQSLRPQELPGKRRASVALVLRRGAEGLEMCFIKRTIRAGDRWSGDVAFPGGKQEEGETAEQAAKREVLEEIGLDLDQPGSWECLGHLHDRPALELIVRCYVFLQVQVPTGDGLLPLHPEPNEVAACGWCPLKHFLRPTREIMVSRGFPRARFDGKAGKTKPMQFLNALCLPWLLGLHEMHYHCLDLPMRDTHPPDACGKFRLWGLTLGMVNEFLVMASLRPPQDSLEVYAYIDFLGYRIERCYHKSLLQSILVKLMFNLAERLRGPGKHFPLASRWLLYTEVSFLLPLVAVLLRMVRSSGRVAT